MKTIQVVNVRWYNATAWYGVTLAHCLQKNGHDTLVAGLANTPPLIKAAELGLSTLALPLNSGSPGKLIELVHGMNEVLKSFRPDIVNCHRGEAFILWAMLKRKYGFSLVRTRGDRRLPKHDPINRWLHGKAADAVIATNSLMARHFSEVLHVPEPHLHTILGGVDTQRFSPDPQARQAMRRLYGFSDDDIVMGLLGRMDKVKGIQETIQAMSAVREKDPRAERLKFLVIGFDSEYTSADAARWCKENGLGALGERVVVTGKVARPEAVINALDFGILSSLGSEAIARAALEIMSAGIPLISSTTGVMPDLIPREYSFEPGDIGGMADQISAMLDPLRRHALAELCSQTIKDKKLSLEDFFEQTMSVYRSIVL